MRRWFAVLSVIAVLVMLARLSLPVSAGPPSPCGNACGIPGCSECVMGDGGSICKSHCSGGGGDSGGDEGGGGHNDGDGGDHGGGGDHEGGGGGNGGGGNGEGGGNGDGEGGNGGSGDGSDDWWGMRCYTCMPYPYCPSGYADNFCIVRDRDTGHQWVSTWSCMADASACEWHDDGSDEEDWEVPCEPQGGGGGFSLNNCDYYDEYSWDYYIWVSARVPPHRVQVDPFPRWLVAMGAPLPEPFESGEPGTLTLQDYPAFTPPGLCAPNGPGFSDGCWSDEVNLPDPVREEPEPGDIKDFKIGLRWRRVRNDQPNENDLGPVPPVCWDFDEREWNIGQDYGYGRIPAMECGSTSVTHIYETSSWGKPHNGPRFFLPEDACKPWEEHCCEQVPSGDGEWDMPAYQVRVYTTWAAEWAVQWDEWEVVDTEWGDCFCRPEGEPIGVEHKSCSATAPACGGCSGWCGKVKEPEYGWVHHFEGWHTIDLRDYGSPTWYYTSWAVITTGEGPWCEFEYADPNPGDTVRVPVIEVQSVLRDPCVLNNSCPPGYP